MPSKELANFIAERAALPVPDAPPDIETLRRSIEDGAPPPPDDIRVIDISTSDVRAEWVLTPGADGGRRLLYLHGGGYFGGSARARRRIAADLSRASGCAVLNADYRLAPEHKYPAAVNDALAAYDWMLTNAPDGEGPARSLFVAGDSAGAALALAILPTLRDRGATTPTGAIAMSAATDLTLTAPSLDTRASRDPIISRAGMVGAVARYVGDGDPSEPQASPLFADLHGLPPLYLNVGDDEALLDDTLRFAARAAEAAVDVTLHVEPGGFHTYPYLVPDAPESRFAINRMGEFIRRHG